MENTNTTNNGPTPEEIEKLSIAFKEKQEKVNQERYAWIASLPKEIQDKFHKIEEFVAWMEKENLPLLLFVNPFGYEFEKISETSKGKGFIRYHKFNGTDDIYSEEGRKNLSKCYGSVIDNALSYLSTLAYIRITLEEPDYIFHYIQGKTQSFSKIKQSESLEIKKEETNK